MTLRIDLENYYWKQKRKYDIADRGDYSSFYEHLKVTFLEVIKRRCGILMPNFTQNFVQAFLGNLKRITLRTLIYEMQLCEECGELQGENEEEKYCYFVDYFLSDSLYLKKIYKEYPIMYQDMLSFLVLSAQNICEVIERFESDREEINFHFFQNNPCYKIKRIDHSTSDLHNQGKTVLILELDNEEKLVYKPRSLAIDQVYREFLQWICKSLNITYWWNFIWDRGEYGWCSWVSELPCISYDELERYYERNGILLGISYLLGSEDMHYENLVAHGEYPVLIDLELAVGSRRTKDLEDESEEEKRVFIESVLQTGLLPMYVWDKEGEGVNIGAINGGGGQSVSIDFPVVVNPGTVRMHVEYQRPYLKEGKNRAALNGKFIQPSRFQKEIILGFEKVYQFLMQNKELILEKLKSFEKVNVRYLVRQTQEYFLMLILMYHPDYLMNKKGQNILLEELICQQKQYKIKEMQWVQTQEKEELKRGDIPYFWYKANRTNLHSATGNTYKNYFIRTCIQCIKERLFRMSQRNMEYQKKLIQIVISTDNTKQKMQLYEENKLQEYDKQPKRKEVLKDEGIKRERRQAEICIAERIGEILLEEAHWSDDKKSVGWINIMMAEHQRQGCIIRPMELYLYDGIAGVAVFMQKLAKETKKKCYQEMTDILIKKLFSHTDAKAKRIQEKVPTGAFYGEASIGFAYILLYLADKDYIFLKYTKLQCEIMSKSFTEDKDYDVVGGNAGAILVLLCAYKLTGDKQYVEWAREAGDILLSSATRYDWGMGWVNPVTGIALTGFAHGASGIMLAFAKLGFVTGDEKYAGAAYQAFLFEEYFFDEELQDWMDLREVKKWEDIKSNKKSVLKERENGMAWCHGWGGIIMARCLTAKYVKGKFRKKLQKTIDNFIENKTKKEICNSENFCLCHGKSGNEVLCSINKIATNSEQLRKIILEEIGRNLEVDSMNFKIQERNNYGMMAGITGIGYYSLCSTDDIMRILSIDI